MAASLRETPVLTGAVAKRFLATTYENEQKMKSTLDKLRENYPRRSPVK